MNAAEQAEYAGLAIEAGALMDALTAVRGRMEQLSPSKPGEYRIALRPDNRDDDPMMASTLCDDIVVVDVPVFRAEQMDRKSWWVCCYLDNVTLDRITWWVTAKSKPLRLEWRTTEHPTGPHRLRARHEGRAVSSAKFLIGDVFEQMAKLPDGSVDLVLTSPPFLALRSYLPADHPDKGKEIGSEATPAAFLDTLLDLTVEWRRILAPHGSICVELGDTYSGSGGAGGDYGEGGLREDQPGFGGSAGKAKNAQRSEWPLDKSLCCIPALYEASLSYGRNLLNPVHTLEPWRVRNLIAWCRPNPPVGALGDKVRPATSYLTVACMSRKRWFDLDAVREPYKQAEWHGGTSLARPFDNDSKGKQVTNAQTNPAGAPPLDWWSIPTESYKNSHYATWPRDLCVRPIKMMCPEKVCRTCGKPSERITGEATYERTDTDRVPARLAMNDGQRVAEGVNQHKQTNGANTSVTRNVETLGWSSCGHDDWRRGVVLDPFAGSGTTLAVATGLGRDAIGIDLDARNYDLARDRVGMFLGDAL